MKNVLDDLRYRGLIKDYSNEDEMYELLNTPQTIYCGFDPSASSMHVGNYVMISLLMRLQKAGHRIIAVVGGATGMIGDPSGKSKERNLQDESTLKANTEAIRHQLERFINLDDPKKGILLNNYDWLGSLKLLDMLRDYGKYFNINYLLNKDIIASRLDNGISFTEFTYNILQAIDFLHLLRTQNCHIQVGGSDQWGNLTSGLELIRKLEPNQTCSVMTCHLITRADGKKFGKSEKGALFLNPKLTSPYQLYQYFMNVTDEDACKYLKVFTFLEKEEIEKIIVEHLANPGVRIAQRRLAYEIVKDIHSQDDANEAIEMSAALFKGDIKDLSLRELREGLKSAPKAKIEEGMDICDALVSAKACHSKREARDLIKGGSIYANGNKVTDFTLQVKKEDGFAERRWFCR